MRVEPPDAGFEVVLLVVHGHDHLQDGLGAGKPGIEGRCGPPGGSHEAGPFPAYAWGRRVVKRSAEFGMGMPNTPVGWSEVR
ncbi:hypothetical protein GCM10010267_14740 [Streptomyces griseorubens]|nr:hypothetical protein GCM10010267_14740 [Streptomyces griseorubens]